MSDAVALAVRGYARSENLPNFPFDKLDGLVGKVAAEDFDAMYDEIGNVVAFFPSHLHEGLYEVASRALGAAASDTGNRRVGDVGVGEGMEGGDLEAAVDDVAEEICAGEDRSSSERTDAAREWFGDIEDSDKAFFESLRLLAEKESKRSAQIECSVREEAGNTCGEHSFRELQQQQQQQQESGCQDLDTIIPVSEDDAGAGSLPEDSDSSSQHSEGAMVSREVVMANAEAEDERCNWSGEDSESEASLHTPDDSRCDEQRPLVLSAAAILDDELMAVKEVKEADVLCSAGLFSFQTVKRRFGTPYFAEPPLQKRGHEAYGPVPEANEDTKALEARGAPKREDVASGFLPGSRKHHWARRERVALREAVAREAFHGELRGAGEWAGMAEQDVERLRRIVQAWKLEDWKALTARCGSRLGRREAAAVMCRYLHHEAPWVSTRAWTAEEDAALSAAVHDCLATAQSGGWEAVGARLGRGALDAMRRWVRRSDGARRAARSTAWTAGEDRRLGTWTRRLGEGNWAAIALAATDGARTGQQCMHRWTRRAGAGARRRVGRWTDEEMEALRKGVEANGARWVDVARVVGSRSDVQCREKWVNCMDPHVAKGEWTKEEEAVLTEMVRQCGTRWGCVAKGVHGRTASQCQRRWARLQTLSERKRVKSAPEAGAGGGEIR